MFTRITYKNHILESLYDCLENQLSYIAFRDEFISLGSPIVTQNNIISEFRGCLIKFNN